MLRYVILHHRFPGGSASSDPRRRDHWDFMLETLAGPLRTWSLAAQPSSGESIAAEALPDHRAAYLEYEGPVSGDRGEVSRWDAGQYELRKDSPEEIVLTLRGERLQGEVAIRRIAGQWRWHGVPDIS